MRTLLYRFRFLAVPLLFALVIGMAPRVAAQETAPERWLHVRVDSSEAKGEMVRVNLPLSLAEKLLPTIHHGRLKDGCVQIGEAQMNGVDLRAMLEAVRSAKDGEFVTVQSTDTDVRVAKQTGYLLVHVRDNKRGKEQQVEVRVPMPVVEALLSSGKDELDLVAALRALKAHGDTELVRVKDNENTVRVWLDAKNSSE